MATIFLVAFCLDQKGPAEQDRAWSLAFFSLLSHAVRAPAPLLGQDTDRLLRGVLGSAMQMPKLAN